MEKQTVEKSNSKLWKSGTVNSGKVEQQTVKNGIKKISVIPIGFEPMTYSLEGCRSIQLSYGTGRTKGCKDNFF